MAFKSKKTTFIVLDLDDTVYKEINFVKSGFKAIIKSFVKDADDSLFEIMFNTWLQGGDAIKSLFESLNMKDIPVEEPLNIYHNHSPEINLPLESKLFFQSAISKGYPLGMITDGRTYTQQNKLNALRISNIFKKVIISQEFGSEKPTIRNFKIFEELYPGNIFCYIGDNTNKDFIAPISLNWKSYCLRDDGRNIHPQDLASLPQEVTIIDNLNEFFDAEK